MVCSSICIGSRGGYTLLELLLALALSIIVISTIATAIHVNLFSLTRAQARIERKQIARSVLAMIGNDIRAAVQFQAADYSGLENVLLSQQLVAGITPVAEDEQSVTNGDVDNLAVPTTLPDAADVSSPTATGEFSTDAASTDDDETEGWSVGLVGDANYIWLDISRLPRIDQYHPLIRTAQDEVRTGSDIKQVVYYVGSVAPQNGAGSGSVNLEGAQTGLIRDEIDRAVAFYQGGLDPTSPTEFSQLVAAEVVQIGFRYFDSQQWVTQWDSAESDTFPTAVEVSIVLDSNPLADRAGDVEDAADLASGRFERFRIVVHLPLADSETENEEGDDG